MAAGNTPTKYDPKRLISPALLTTAIVAQYTATAAEAGTRLSKAILANTGLRDFDKVWDRDISVGFNDETTDAASAVAADVTIFRTDAQTQGDEFYVGRASKFSHVMFSLSTVLVGATVTLEVAAWTGAAWTVLTAAADSLNDGSNVLKQSGEVSFVPPAAWATTAVNGSTQFWIRFKVLTANPTTGPVGTQVRAGTKGTPRATLYMVPTGGSASANNIVALEVALPIAAGGYPILDVPALDGYVMDASDFLSAKCDVENQVVLHLAGIEMKD